MRPDPCVPAIDPREPLPEASIWGWEALGPEVGFMNVIEAHGAAIPVIGFGTWALKGAACVEAVAEALRIGYRHIDTAAMYANEAAVGEGIRASGVPPEDIFLVTKVWPSDLADGAFQRSVERSLRALRVDMVDLVLIHWPSRELSVAETVLTLNDVKRRGMARHIGVANHSAKQIEQAWQATDAPLVCNQSERHPLEPATDVVAACARHGMAFVAHTPLSRGSVLGRGPIPQIAERLGRTPAQVVLRWHVQSGVAAIPKSARPERMIENLEVFDFELSADDMAAISRMAR